MNLSEALNKEIEVAQAPRKPKCKVCDQLTPQELDDVTRAYNEGVVGDGIARALRSAGYDVSDNTVRRHLRDHI